MENQKTSAAGRLLDAMTVVGVLCAVAATGIVIRRELAPPPPPAESQAPTDVPNWKEYIPTGRLIGNPSAPLRIVEFADFQCPACKGLHTMFDRLRKERPNDFAVYYHYAPLPYHAEAYPAAKAAECAAEQGRFSEYHDALFMKADSLNAAVYPKLAVRVGVPDIPKFEQCFARKDSVARVLSDRALAFTTLHIRGTPTTIINGKMYLFAPPFAELTKMLDDAKAGAKN